MDDKKSILCAISLGKYKLAEKKNSKNAIWEVFAEICKPDGSLVEGFLVCRKCKNAFKYDGKRTSNLNRHKCFSEIHYARPYKRIKFVNNNADAENSKPQLAKTIGVLNIKKEEIENAEIKTENDYIAKNSTSQPTEIIGVLNIKKEKEENDEIKTDNKNNANQLRIGTLPIIGFPCMCGCHTF